MTNHIPNDLSHLSEAEFNSLCPQGEHAPGPEPLSPAAQAVLDAATEGFWRSSFNSESNGAAAALRAAADQVIPEVLLLGSDYQEIALQEARKAILAIANELERQ
jgi:hypothetical protein